LRRYFWLTVTATLVLAACSSPSPSPSATEATTAGVVEIVDQGGVNVVIPQPVERIASAYSMSTYYVYVVGEGDRLVAAEYLGARDEAGKAVMRRIDPNFDAIAGAGGIASQQDLNVEELAALEPDLVLGSLRSEWLPTVEELGIPIIRYEGETPEKLKEAVLLTGQALGPEATARAQVFVDYYGQTLADILAQTDGIAEDGRPRVYFSGTEPLRVASGEMYQTYMIEAAGGVSVSKDLSGYWNDVNMEQVLIWNPDVIFVPPYGGASVEAITASPEWAEVAAVRNGRVYMVPKLVAPWDTPVPDSVLGIIWMADKLYPGQLTLDCAAETKAFYNQFYNYAISDGEVEALCR
jgi:iron complex transport system substrate-binding protein